YYDIFHIIIFTIVASLVFLHRPSLCFHRQKNSCEHAQHASTSVDYCRNDEIVRPEHLSDDWRDHAANSRPSACR
ncbi:hypothetical protein PMAYCL1PPCAC_20923, partial [Pristionchus mayeri]